MVVIRRVRRAGWPATVLLVTLSLTAPQPRAEARFEGEGRVVAVDEARGTVTLDHGPIPGFMPAMRMKFPVEPVERLRGLQVGDVVRFSIQAQGSRWAIATIERAEERSAPRSAAVEAPEFTLPTLSGASVRLSDLRGKVVLVNFWATWCLPCRMEMPTIEAFYQRYKDQGLAVLAVNLDVLSTAGVEAFVKEVGVTFPIILDPSWATARAYRVVGLPTTYLIDRAGNVVVREVGERDWGDGVSQMAVERLLNEPAATTQR